MSRHDRSGILALIGAPPPRPCAAPRDTASGVGIPILTLLQNPSARPHVSDATTTASVSNDAPRTSDSSSTSNIATSADPVLTVDEIAQLLRVGRNTVYALVAKNRIPHRRLGKQIRFSRASVMSWLATSWQVAKEGK